MQKKILLVAFIVLSIFVVYTSCGINPDFVVVNVGGYNWGVNVTDYIYLRLITFGLFLAYLLSDERDN